MDAATSFWATPGGWTLITLGQILLITVGVLVAVAFLLLADRKVWASVQMRKGPNVVGPFGLLQSFADMIKFVLKEVVIPSGADKAVFILAPIITVVLAFMAWAVIPFAPGWVVSDLNVGILYIFAISSLGVYGIIMGGWASNSKYPFLGSLRSAAQMISYEVSLGLIIIGIIISTQAIVANTIKANIGPGGTASPTPLAAKNSIMMSAEPVARISMAWLKAVIFAIAPWLANSACSASSSLCLYLAFAPNKLSSAWPCNISSNCTRYWRLVSSILRLGSCPSR